MTDPDFGSKLFKGVGFPTPVSIPDDTACRLLTIPASADWLALVMGALLLLTEESNWQQLEGGISRADAAARARQLVDDAYAQAETGVCEATVETPYWDTDSDVGLDELATEQTWYGVVANVFAAPDGITFSENLQVWTFAGLLAIAGAPGAAISFVTIAPKMIIAVKGRDVGEIIRVIIDGQDAARVDTTGHAGEVINTTVVGNPANTTHQLYLIKQT